MAVSQIAGAVVGELCNAGVLQPVPRLFPGLGLFFPGALVTAQRGPQPVAGTYMATHHHVLQHRHLVKQTDVLEGAGDACGGHSFDLLREVRCIGNGKFAAVCRVQPGDQVETGGFTRAVRANQTVNFAFVDRE